MSIYTSLTISRRRAMEIILAKLANASNDDLKEMAFAAMDANNPHNFYNIYMVVDADGPDDNKI